MFALDTQICALRQPEFSQSSAWLSIKTTFREAYQDLALDLSKIKGEVASQFRMVLQDMVEKMF